jgi:hypothetical protein
MRNEHEHAIRERLAAGGLSKLPAPVLQALSNDVEADLSAAMHKIITKRTAPKAIARLFARCVLDKARDSKGDAIPFCQLGSANASEPRTIIGECEGSNKQDISK